jgi:hypothetical protein
MALSSFGRRLVRVLCLSPVLGIGPGCLHEPPGTILNTGGAGGSSAGSGAAGSGALSGATSAGAAGASGAGGQAEGAGAGGAGAGGAGAGGESAGAGSGGAAQSGQGGAAAGSAGTAGGGSGGGAAGGGPVCGGKYCGADEYCCNPSCGTCAPRGQGCLADPCDRMRCGRLLCAEGSSCCSASCEECGSACGAITTCEPRCEPMDARFQGDGSLSLGWFWDGDACVDRRARSCSGQDCDDGFTLQSECEAAFAACLD